MIYFDNSSTYGIKSKACFKAMIDYQKSQSSNPNRGANQSTLKSIELIESAKQSIKLLLNAHSIEQIHWCYNATHGLNMIIQGLLNEDDLVITTATEHNSVLRPLQKLIEEKKIRVKLIIPDENGFISDEKIEKAFARETPKLTIINHASNVTGIVNNIKKFCDLALKTGSKSLVDASQTAGLLDIDVQNLNVDYLVATGHKALKGPSGTGLVYAKSLNNLKPIIVGGTGNNSFSLYHPEGEKQTLEAGTCNFHGIVGLGAAVKELLNEKKKPGLKIAQTLENKLKRIPEVDIIAPTSMNYEKVPIVSFNINGLLSQEVEEILNSKYSIVVRGGLQCAPLIHKSIGTFPNGVVRASLGSHNKLTEVNKFIKAIKSIVTKEEKSLQRSK